MTAGWANDSIPSNEAKIRMKAIAENAPPMLSHAWSNISPRGPATKSLSKRINARAVIRTALFRSSRVLSVQRVQSHVGVSENSGRYRRCFAPDPLYNAGVTNPKSKQLANKSGKRDDIGSNASWNKFGKPDPKGVQKERSQGSITDLQRNCQQHVSECMCVCADRQAGRQRVAQKIMCYLVLPLADIFEIISREKQIARGLV